MPTPGPDPEHEGPAGTFAGASELEAEFEELLREHDGDGQAATDA